MTIKTEVEPSEKEILIVEMYANGLTARGISHKLNMSYRTVEGHINTIKKKFGAVNIPNLIAIFFRNNIIK